MLVTRIRELKPEKFEVTFEDGSFLKVGLSQVAEFSIYKGRDLSEDELLSLRDSARTFSSKERALRMIGARPMSCKELYDKLVQKGETKEDAEECVEWLLSLHYLDDAQYAGMVVRHYAAKGYGITRIKNELFRRGVAKSLWDEALKEMPQQDDKVYDLLCKKLKGENPDRAELKKATDSLFRRGFSWDEIKRGLERYKSETEFD